MDLAGRWDKAVVGEVEQDVQHKHRAVQDEQFANSEPA